MKTKQNGEFSLSSSFFLSLLPFSLPPSLFSLKCPTIHFRLSLINTRKRGTPEFHGRLLFQLMGALAHAKSSSEKVASGTCLGDSNRVVHRPQRVGFRKNFYCKIHRWSLIEKGRDAG